MKVSDLEKGDMLSPAEGMEFVVTNYDLSSSGPWLRSRKIPVNLRRPSRSQASSQFMIYLGTKKDTGSTTAWSNRFCLIDNQIVAVEPSCWKWIQKKD